MLDIKCNINEHIIYKEKEKLEQGFTGRGNDLFTHANLKN